MHRDSTMKIKQMAIEGAAALILDRHFWLDCKMFVRDVAQTGLTKEEKHEAVKRDLFIIFGDIGSTLMDIGIKLAVLYLKSVEA